ncbi:MAG: hypothetical protein EHM93_03125 [Bacteroidales bacterium]|nr:MAG: hypothetical protein EHM93_03125 [Bacteroidales bacterium]
MKIQLKIYAVILAILLCGKTSSQDIPVSFRNEAIYDFLDELANEKIIAITSAVKPFTNNFILKCLNDADKSRTLLSIRQVKELDFYLLQYRFLEGKGKNSYTDNKKGNIINVEPRFNVGYKPLGLHYKDSLFSFSLRPIWGIREYISGGSKIMHTWGGAEAWGSIGKISIYASLRDNYQTEILAKPQYFTQNEGGNYKVNVQGRKGGDFSEMRGGVIYGWGWGSFGLVKDQIQWGTNYHGASVFSGRTPSFAMIKLQLKPVKWFELNYIHGWLVSEVIDSSRSYTSSTGDFRTVYCDKYIAANMLTFRPIKDIAFSVGNSIVYADSKIQPAYLIPIMFFKSIDHTLSHGIDNQNSQMFLDLSIRSIKHLHLYTTIFFDEFSVTRIGDSKRHNFISQKYGSRLSNWPIRNTSFTFEYTKTNPVVYKHRVPTTTFETNKFNLGHYLRDNSDEIYGAVDVRPFRGFLLRGDITYARHGNEYDYTTGSNADELPFIKDVTWQNITLSFTCRWEFIHDSWLYLNLAQSSIKGFDVDGHTAQYYLDLYTPKSFQGDNLIVIAGLNFGF